MLTESIHAVKFSASAQSPAVKIDPRDKIVAIKTTSSFVGTTLHVELSFDDGATFQLARDESGNQTLIISDATNLAAGGTFSVDWVVTEHFRLVSSSSNSDTVNIITKRRT